MRRTAFLPVFMVALLGSLLPAGLFAQAKKSPLTQATPIVTFQQLQGVVNPFNPPNYKNNLAMPSGVIISLVTLQKQGVSHPATRALEKAFGLEPAPSPGNLSPGPRPLPKAPGLSPGPPASICNTQTGNKFNLEPPGGSPGLNFVMPQDETPVDFIPGGGASGADLVVGGANDYRGIFEGFVSSTPGTWGFSGTGYYVHRSGGQNDCSTAFEGGLPHLVDSFGFVEYGGGRPRGCGRLDSRQCLHG